MKFHSFSDILGSIYPPHLELGRDTNQNRGTSIDNTLLIPQSEQTLTGPQNGAVDNNVQGDILMSFSFLK